MRAEVVRPSPVPQLFCGPFIGDRNYDAGMEPSELPCPTRELAVHRIPAEEACAERLVVPWSRQVEHNGTARRGSKATRVEIEDLGANLDLREA